VSQALQQYNEQKKEANALLDFHTELYRCRTKAVEIGRGRRHSDLEVLHKSAIVLLTACWEAYVEKILTESITIIARDLSDPLFLNTDLRRAVAVAKTKKVAVSGQNEMYPWFFVGDGWRQLLLEFARWKISELNTPDTSAIRELSGLLLGIDPTQSWGRTGKNAKDAMDRLDEYLSDRHVIAHGAIAGKKFSKSYVTDYLAFLDITVQKTEDTIRACLKNLGLALP
jgi:hypothetical protein